MTETAFHPPDLMQPDLAGALESPDPAVVQALHPETLERQPTMAETIEQMHGLPFISTDAIERNLTYPEGVDLQFIPDASFPINRIVGVRGFDSWAGRGLTKDGKAVDKDGYPSASAVHHYSQNPPKPGYQPSLNIFKDSEGQVWGYTDLDGAHRTAGAKSRGEETLLCTVRTTDYDSLPVFEGNIADEVLRQKDYRDGLIGRVALKRSVRRLIRATKQGLAESKQRAHDDIDYI